jgi:hypothetical protein
MRNRIGTSLGLAIALSLVGALVATAGEAGRPFRSVKARALLDAETFGVSAQYSGAVIGEIRIDGVSYRIAPDASIYEIGSGLVPLGTVVQDRYVYLTGLKIGRTMMVYAVALRPASESEAAWGEPAAGVSLMTGMVTQ